MLGNQRRRGTTLDPSKQARQLSGFFSSDRKRFSAERSSPYPPAARDSAEGGSVHALTRNGGILRPLLSEFASQKLMNSDGASKPVR